MKKILIALFAIALFNTCDVKAQEIDWQTNISLEQEVPEFNELQETMYTTVYLNKRTFPNINSEVDEVLPPSTSVNVVGEYHGWSKIKDGDKYFYVWNSYLSSEIQKEYLGDFMLTAYCSCEKCCGKWSSYGLTASGVTPTQGVTVAMNDIPFGTKLKINGQVYTVQDRGTKYGHVDIYFSNHSDALRFGQQYAPVFKIN